MSYLTSVNLCRSRSLFMDMIFCSDSAGSPAVICATGEHANKLSICEYLESAELHKYRVHQVNGHM